MAARRATAKALTGRPAAAPLSFELRGALLPALLQRPTRLLLRHATFGPPHAAALADACRRHVATDAGSKADADACAALFGEDDDPLVVNDDDAVKGGRASRSRSGAAGR